MIFDRWLLTNSVNTENKDAFMQRYDTHTFSSTSVKSEKKGSRNTIMYKFIYYTQIKNNS